MGTRITVTCEVDQVECIKLGIGADRTTEVEVDLATWTVEERADLARRWVSGKIVGLLICPPDVGGLLFGIRKSIERDARYKAKEGQQDAERLARVIEEVLAGRINHVDQNIYARLPDDCKAVLEARKAAAVKELKEQQAVRAAEDAAEAMEEAAKKQRFDAQIEEFLPFAPGLLAARYAAGLACTEEVLSAIIAQERGSRDVKFIDYDDFMVLESEVATINDLQFNHLQHFLKKLPTGVVTKIYNYVDNGEDGEEFNESVIVAEAHWKVGEVDITANQELGD